MLHLLVELLLEVALVTHLRVVGQFKSLSEGVLLLLEDLDLLLEFEQVQLGSFSLLLDLGLHVFLKGSHHGTVRLLVLVLVVMLVLLQLLDSLGELD